MPNTLNNYEFDRAIYADGYAAAMEADRASPFTIV